jgi:hypothetical protein
MSKTYTSKIELEFEADASIDDITTTLMKYRNSTTIAETKINNVVITSIDDNLYNKIYKAFNNITDEELSLLKDLEEENQELQRLINNSKKVDDDNYYKFCLNISLPYITNKEEFIKEMTSLYNYNLIKIVTTLLIILNSTDINLINNNIINLLNLITSKDQLKELNMSLEIVNKYSKNKKQLNDLFFNNITDNIKSNCKNKLKVNEEKIKILTKKLI